MHPIQIAIPPRPIDGSNPYATEAKTGSSGRVKRTLGAEELARDVEGLTSHDDDLLAVQQLLSDSAGQATKKVSLAVNDDLKETRQPISNQIFVCVQIACIFRSFCLCIRVRIYRRKSIDIYISHRRRYNIRHTRKHVQTSECNFKMDCMGNCWQRTTGSVADILLFNHRFQKGYPAKGRARL